MSTGIGRKQQSFLDDAPAVWRPIHYLGSKLRLVPVIREMLDGLSDGPVCDLFAGSGTVSLALSQTRDVLAADIQEYSRVICSALLTPHRRSDKDVEDFLQRVEQTRSRLERCLEPLLAYEQKVLELTTSQPDLLCDLVDNGSLIEGGSSGNLAVVIERTSRWLKTAKTPLLATTYYGGRYFSFRQAVFIDSVLAECEGDTSLAALLSTASDLVNSVGKQFAQPMRPRRKDGTIKANLVLQMCRDRLVDASKVFSRWLSRYRSIEQERTHRVVRGDYREVLAAQRDVAVIYADPPYTRDHYSRFYHVLETLCLKDFPNVSTTSKAGPTSRGLYRTDRHQSPFCIKSQAASAFAELFAGAKGVPLLLSYSPFIENGHPRLMTIENVVDLAKHRYRRVEVVPAKLVHSKLNRTDLHRDASANAEVFLMCR